MELSEAIERMKERNRELVARQKKHSDYTRQTDKIISAMMKAEEELERLRRIERFCTLAELPCDEIEEFPPQLLELLISDQRKGYRYITNATLDDIIELGQAVRWEKVVVEAENYDTGIDEATIEKTAINSIYKKMKLRKRNFFPIISYRKNKDGLPVISRKILESWTIWNTQLK